MNRTIVILSAVVVLLLGTAGLQIWSLAARRPSEPSKTENVQTAQNAAQLPAPKIVTPVDCGSIDDSRLTLTSQRLSATSMEEGVFQCFADALKTCSPATVTVTGGKVGDRYTVTAGTTPDSCTVRAETLGRTCEIEKSWIELLGQDKLKTGIADEVFTATIFRVKNKIAINPTTKARIQTTCTTP